MNMIKYYKWLSSAFKQDINYIMTLLKSRKLHTNIKHSSFENMIQPRSNLGKYLCKRWIRNFCSQICFITRKGIIEHQVPNSRSWINSKIVSIVLHCALYTVHDFEKCYKFVRNESWVYLPARVFIILRTEFSENVT